MLVYRQTTVFCLCFISGFVMPLSEHQHDFFYKTVSNETSYVILGLFPVNVSQIDIEGILWSEVFRYYLKQSNNACQFFSYQIYDLPYVYKSYVITNITLDMVLDKDMYSDTNEYDGSCACEPKNKKLNNVLGIVGPTTSTSTEYISALTRYENIPIISYSATSDSLSDTQHYPNVLRTIPSDSVQVEVIKSLLDLFNWSYISLLYEDSSYGKSGRNLIINKFCLYKEIRINSDYSNINESLNEIRTKGGSKVVILYGLVQMTQAVLDAAWHKNISNIVWILSEASGINSWFLEFRKKFDSILFHMVPTGGEVPDFQKYFLDLNYSTSLKSPWLKRFFEQNGINDAKSTVKIKDLNKTFDFSYVSYVRNAILTYTNFLNSHYTKDTCDAILPVAPLTELVVYLKNFSFVASNGTEVSFNENGDIKESRFNIYTIEPTSANDTFEFRLFSKWLSTTKHLVNIDNTIFDKYKSVTSKCSNTCTQGFTNLTYDSTKPCCWTCTVCPKNQIKPLSGNTKCQNCPLGKIATNDRTRCVSMESIYVRYSDYQGIIILVISVSSMIISIIIIAVFVAKRNTPVIRSSNYTLSLVQLLCHVVLSGLVILFPGNDSLRECQVRTYGLSFFYILVISIIIIKTTRLLAIFKVKHILTKADKKQQQTTEMIMILVFVVINVVITVILEEMSPLNIVVSNPVSHIVIRYCDNYDSSVALLIYVMCLQILCGIQSFRGRNLPGKYNEAKYISFAMFQSTILLILSLLLRKNIQKLEDSLLVQSCLLVFANLSILITLYGYKLLVVLFRPAENTLNVFRKRVGKLQINSDKSLHSRVH